MATAVVPKIVLTVNHASGAGYYAMAGQGFDPDFILSWPTGRMGVMEGESAVMAVHGPEIEKARRERREPSPEAKASIESMRADYEHQLDAKFAAARGFVDAIVTPEETRDQLAFPLRVTANYRRPAPRPVRAAAARRGHSPLGTRMPRAPDVPYSLGALVLRSCLRARSRAAESSRCPKPNIDPGRVHPDGRVALPAEPEPAPDDTLQPMVAARGARTAMAGCRSPAPASDQFLAQHPTP